MLKIVYQEFEDHSIETEVVFRFSQGVGVALLKSFQDKNTLYTKDEYSLGEWKNAIEDCEVMVQSTFSSQEVCVKTTPFFLPYLLEVFYYKIVFFKGENLLERCSVFNYSQGDDYLSLFEQWCDRNGIEYQTIII